jgi:hypothetical protein
MYTIISIPPNVFLRVTLCIILKMRATDVLTREIQINNNTVTLRLKAGIVETENVKSGKVYDTHGIQN